MSPNKASHAQLEQVLIKGGALVASPTLCKQLPKLAEQHKLALFIAQCDKARSPSAVLRAVAKAVDYPVFFGSDLEDLFDCLNDTLIDYKHGFILYLADLHWQDDALLEFIPKVQEVFSAMQEAAHSKQKVFVYGIENAGKHPAPEPGIAPEPYGGASDD
ncbi:barstar family protein [Brackiella oedipodis]|uniref:barstar family protein n=1 Tax=Brackiella oedipodis TaxID=124225 RepID=UPI00049003A6|nr:barstar family protein [Brackiella oedipodis]